MKWAVLFPSTMEERLQKLLSQAGIASRRSAETLITSGRVAVNGIIVTELGSKANPKKDRISVDDKPITFPQSKIYILLNKPAGYVTTMKDPEGRPIVTDLLNDIKERLFPVGRLDFNTEGLLLLTNDGNWANTLAHPRHEVTKEYHVKVRGDVSPEILAKLANGVKLDDGWTAPARVELLRVVGKNSWISISIHEGRYRQVRRMCETMGLLVSRLTRTRYGELSIGLLKPGEYRYLTMDEVHAITVDEQIAKPGKTKQQKTLHRSKNHGT